MLCLEADRDWADAYLKIYHLSADVLHSSDAFHPSTQLTYQIVETLITPTVLPILVDSKPLPSSRITHLIGGFLLSAAMTYTSTDVLMRGHDQTKYLLVNE